MTSDKLSKNETIELFLQDYYSFRFNTIKCRAEFCSSGRDFQPVTRFTLNSIKRQLDSKLGVTTSIENIRSILESDYSVRVNPIQEYFLGLPKISDQNTIQKLASTVIVRNAEHWEEYLTKWLTAVVANAITDIGCQNHTCLVLTGSQGKFKTTWLDNLCPHSLKSHYLYTGKIDPLNKDVCSLLSENLYLNIDDQLKALNKRDENELKNLITCPLVKYRRPYDIFIEEYPHIASFMASVNGNDFLTDPTGSRRFLPFEVIEIEIEAAKAINMDDVYSEAMFLLESGFRYWFIDSEIEELHRQSTGFHVQTIEYEMLMRGFERPSTNDSNAFLTTSEILAYLKGYSLLNLSEKRMGTALKQAGFERKSKRLNGNNPIYGWIIQKVTPNPFI